MITYYKLFDLLNRRGMTRGQLRSEAGLAFGTITRISKQEPVNLKTIDAICRVLNCQPGDILQYENTDQDYCAKKYRENR